jgi:hypothetical protein
LFATCKKEHIAPVNQLVKDLFCFKEGSEWIYYDSITQTTTVMSISNYEQTAYGYPKLYGKVRNFGETIKFDITIVNLSQSESVSHSGTTWLKAEIEQDNTLKDVSSHIFTPVKTYLSLGCDENNHFSISVTYLNTYELNGTTYSDVYMFNINNIIYYVARYIGFVRCVQYDNFDLVLIDKTIK